MMFQTTIVLAFLLAGDPRPREEPTPRIVSTDCAVCSSAPEAAFDGSDRDRLFDAERESCRRCVQERARER
jgi:hypothetical protein